MHEENSFIDFYVTYDKIQIIKPKYMKFPEACCVKGSRI